MSKKVKCKYCEFELEPDEWVCLNCGRKTQYGIDKASEACGITDYTYPENDTMGQDKIDITDEENTYE